MISQTDLEACQEETFFSCLELIYELLLFFLSPIFTFFLKGIALHGGRLQRGKVYALLMTQEASFYSSLQNL